MQDTRQNDDNTNRPTSHPTRSRWVAEKSNNTLAAFAISLFLAAVPSAALAKDVGGRFGFGGSINAGSGTVPASDNSIFPLATVDALYWLTPRIGLEGRIGYQIQAPDGGDTAVRFRGGFGALFNIARWEQANLQVGLRLLGDVASSGAENVDPNINLGFEVPLRGEYFFSDHFAVNAQVGLGVDVALENNSVGRSTVVGAGTTSSGAFGGFGFIFYL